MATAKKPAAKKPAAKKAAPVARAKPTRAVPKVSAVKGKSIEWYVSTIEPWQQDIVREVGALIAAAAPRATGSIKWAQPVWEFGGPFAFARAAKSHVTIGFWRGAELTDTAGLLEGDGDRMKHLKIKAGEKVPAVLGALIRQAVGLNEERGDPTKK